MEEKIYKVIKIIDDTSIVINAGSDDGITTADKFEIFTIGNEIKDPDTGEILGTLDTIKDTVSVDNLFPKMCICRDVMVIKGLSNYMNELTKVKYQTLNVDVTQISGGLSEDLTIRIGDKARLIKR